MNGTVIRARRAVLVTHALLLAEVLLWQALTRDTAIVAALFAIPLLLPWPGLLRGRRYTHAWATLCVTPCLVLGLVEAVANPGGRLWAALCVALSLLLFTSLVFYLRVTRDTAVAGPG